MQWTEILNFRGTQRMTLSIRVARARAYLRKVDGAISGQGGSNRTFSLACKLLDSSSNDQRSAGFSLPPSEVLALLEEWNEKCKPRWSRAELIHKVNGAAARLCQNSGTEDGRLDCGKANPQCELFDSKYLAIVAARVKRPVFNLLSEKSRYAPLKETHHSFLSKLYDQPDRILIFSNYQSQGQYMWSHTSNPSSIPVGGPDGIWFLPQPVDGLWHPNPRESLKLSRRSEESVIRWKYFVLESDIATPDDWIKALVQQELRIAAIYTSGKRSIHALCQADAQSKLNLDAEIAKVRPELVKLGADPKCLTAVRLTRLPGCWRDKSPQQLLYLNPNPIARAIIDL